MKTASRCEKPVRGRCLELTYLHGGEVINQPGEVLGPRTLADFEMVYVIEGRVTYLADGVSSAVPPGGFIFARPGFPETYHWDTQMPTRHAFFHFGIDIYPSDWPDIKTWPRVRTALSPVCVSLFRHILQHIYEHNDWPAVRPGRQDCRPVEALIDTFFENHRADASFDRDRPEPVRRALMLLRKTVEENPHRTLSLADVAGCAHVTEKHLCRLFSDSLNYSPMQTFSLLKLQASCPLLARTNLTVAEIADRCGFENPLYFSRRFSQAFGCSPRNYRESLRNEMPQAMVNLLPVDVLTRILW
jgi:AraC family transcriptional regulator